MTVSRRIPNGLISVLKHDQASVSWDSRRVHEDMVSSDMRKIFSDIEEVCLSIIR